jgi:hypothetical protein
MDLGSELHFDALARHLAAFSAALGYTLRFVLVAAPATTPPLASEQGRSWKERSGT